MLGYRGDRMSLTTAGLDLLDYVGPKGRGLSVIPMPGQGVGVTAADGIGDDLGQGCDAGAVGGSLGLLPWLDIPQVMHLLDREARDIGRLCLGMAQGVTPMGGGFLTGGVGAEGFAPPVPYLVIGRWQDQAGLGGFGGRGRGYGS